MQSIAEATVTERHFLNLKDESSLASMDPVEENQFSSELHDGAVDSI